MALETLQYLSWGGARHCRPPPCLTWMQSLVRCCGGQRRVLLPLPRSKHGQSAGTVLAHLQVFPRCFGPCLCLSMRHIPTAPALDPHSAPLGPPTPCLPACLPCCPPPCPCLARYAAAGLTGLMDPVEPGLACGSDTAHLSLFGYDPRTHYRGRGAFESMGAGGWAEGAVEKKGEARGEGEER